MRIKLTRIAVCLWSVVSFAKVTTPQTYASEWYTIHADAGRVDYNMTTAVLAYDDYGGLDLYFDVFRSTLTSAGVCYTCDHADLASPNKHIGQPAWNPAGTYFVFQAQNTDAGCLDSEATPGSGLCNNLWAMDVLGVAATELYTVAGAGEGGLLHPHVSGDGLKVYFSERTVETPSTWRLAVCDIEFVFPPSVSGCVYHAPAQADGFYEAHGCLDDACDELVFSCICDAADNDFDDFDIATYKVSTMTYTKLTNTQNEWDEHAIVGPDGRIVWMSSKDTTVSPLRTDWWIMDSDGSNKQRLTYFNDANHPEYISAGAIAADSTWVTNNRFVGFRQAPSSNTGRISVYQIQDNPRISSRTNLKKPVRVNGQ